MEPTGQFTLTLRHAYWLSDNDQCGHGDIELLVHDIDLIGETAMGWNLNWTAVRLLESALADTPPDNHEQIVCCIENCGQNIGYFVHHHDGLVTLSQFENLKYRQDSEHQQFIHLHVTLPWRKYAAQVYDFARRALDFLPEDRAEDPTYISLYRELRQEHVRLLEELTQRLREHE